MARRIYYETHIAPLLRMQGFFNKFAPDLETAAGERLPVIANAAERRDADGALLCADEAIEFLKPIPTFTLSSLISRCPARWTD